MGKKVISPVEIDAPIILQEGENSYQDFLDLKNKNNIWKIVDLYEKQLGELFEILNPSQKVSPEYIINRKAFIDSRIGEKDQLVGNWIYFPWNGYLIHSVLKDEYIMLRTNRNKNLITAEEQNKLRDFCVGVVGLSVGNSIAVGLAHHGVGNLKLAELDSLDTSNINRVRASIYHVGLPKIAITAQQIYEIDPYSRLQLYPNGLSEDNLENFINMDVKPKIVFEIIDDFAIKIKLRLAARKARIPVVMFSNLGDSILIDIERYDLDGSLQLFNGLIGDLPEKILNNPNEDTNKYAVEIVGIQNVPERALASVREIGKTLVGRPQLSSTVTIAGGIASFLVRQYVLENNLISGRKVVRFKDIF